jgi:hypothetical protein
MQKWVLAWVVACLVVASRVGADVLVNIHTETRKSAPAMTQPVAGVGIIGSTDPLNEAAAATTRPAIDEAVSVLAVPGHPFAGRFEDHGRAVNVGGSIEPIANGRFAVHIQFDNGEVQTRTTVILQLGESCDLCGMTDGATTWRSWVLTLTATKP